MARAYPETDLQIQCVAWFRYNYPTLASLLVYINNSSSSIRAAVRNKRMGISAGFPDLFLFLSNTRYAGLAIELKAKSRKPTPEQLAIHAKLIEEGYQVAVIRSLDAFVELVKDFLK